MSHNYPRLQSSLKDVLARIDIVLNGLHGAPEQYIEVCIPHPFLFLSLSLFVDAKNG